MNELRTKTINIKLPIKLHVDLKTKSASSSVLLKDLIVKILENGVRDDTI